MVWNLQCYLRLPSQKWSDLDKCLHCLYARQGVTWKSAPLVFNTFFPSLLPYLRNPAMSLTTTIKDIPSTPLSFISYWGWWMVTVISNLFRLLFSQSKTVWSCHLLAHFLCVNNMGQRRHFWKTHAGASKNPVVYGLMKWFHWIQQGMIYSLQKCLEVIKHFSIFQRNFQYKTTVKFLFHPFNFKWWTTFP